MNEDEYDDYERQEHLCHLYEIKDDPRLLLNDALTSPFWKRVDTRHEDDTWSFRFECDRFTVDAPPEYDALNDKRFTHADWKKQRCHEKIEIKTLSLQNIYYKITFFY